MVTVAKRVADRVAQDEVHQRGLPAWPVTTINGRPAEAAAAALAALERVADPLLVHFDVDAIDSTDYPLANVPPP